MSHNNYFRYKHSNKKEVNSGADKHQMQTYDWTCDRGFTISLKSKI